MQIFRTLLALVLLSSVAQAQFPGAESNTSASLVSNVGSIEPGEPFWVALRLEMDPTWHTYWKNPGDAGLATTLTWKNLPEGFKAGDFHWPTPKVYDQEGIINYVYEDVVYLMFEVTPPKDLELGTTISLEAQADWLECDPTTCVPGGDAVSLTLPVKAAKPTSTKWAAEFEKTRQAWPEDLSASWTLSARQLTGEDNKVSGYELSFVPKDGANQDISEAYFFSNTIQVMASEPQNFSKQGNGYKLLLSKDTYFKGDDTRIIGVLKTKDSWLASRKVIGMAVNIPFVTQKDAAQAANAAATESAGIGDESEGPSLLGILGLAFAGGLILNLMPCVFPVIGLKIMSFVNQAGEERGKIVLHGLVFTAGVLISFWVLATILIVLRAGGEELGWGFQLQEPGFVLALTVLLLVFGLNMSGVFEIGTSAVGVGSNLTAKSGVSGSFFSGVLATVVATPCAAPFLAPALGAALSLPALSSLAVFTAIGIGLSGPYLLLSAFPGLVQKLPRPGAWMETFKQAMAFLLYGTVVALVWVLSAQLNERLMLGVLLGLVIIACGCWVYGRWAAPHKKKQTQWIARLIAFACVAAPLAYAFGGISQQAHENQLKAQIAAGEVKQDFLIWEPWSEEKVNELREAGRFVYIDFTARWCATCQVNKRSYKDQAVIDIFLANDVALLKADWTNKDPAITRALEQFGRSAVPFNLLYAPGHDEPYIMPELFGAGAVLDALKEMGAKVES